MDAFGNNAEDPADPIDRQLEDPQWVQDYFDNDNSAAAVAEGDTLYEEEQPLLQEEFVSNNSAAAVAEGDMVQGDHQGEHREPAANISAVQTQSESVPFKIKVEFLGRQRNKRSRNFFVEPNDKVSLVKKLLVSRAVEVPKRCSFSSNGVVLNEDRSFQDQGIRGVGVPKLEMLDNGSNFPCVCPEATSSEQGGRATAEVLLCDQCGGTKSR